jgi:hypothetical protein
MVFKSNLLYTEWNTTRTPDESCLDLSGFPYFSAVKSLKILNQEPIINLDIIGSIDNIGRYAM